jgi:putative ABC transport system permease protein
MILYFKLALRYLLGRKMRTLLTTLAIVFGVMIFGLNGALPAVRDSFRQTIMTASDQVDLTLTSEIRSAFSEKSLERVLAAEGVAYAAGSLSRPVILPASRPLQAVVGQPVSSLFVTGIDPERAYSLHTFPLAAGRLIESSDSNAMLISEYLAEKTGLGLGDQISLPSASGQMNLTILGVIKARPNTGLEEVFISLPDAQVLFNLPGQITTIEALFTSGANPAIVQEAVLENLGHGYKVGGGQVGNELLAVLEMGELIFYLFGTFALSMGGFIIFITFRTVVIERRRDIGMLRAVGASRRTILGLIFAESLLQGVVGTTLGLVAGYLLVNSLIAAMRPMWESQIHTPMGNPSFGPQIYIPAIFMGIGITLLAGLLPARAAARISPLDALRPSLGESTWQAAGKRALIGGGLIGLALLALLTRQIGLISLGALLFLVGLVLIAPALVHPIAAVFGKVLALTFAREGALAQGNLVRQPGRSATTASAMMIGFAILVGISGMVSSMTEGTWRFIDQSMGSDYLLMPQSIVLGSGNIGARPELAESLRSIPGVSVVSSLRYATTQANEKDLQLVGIDPHTYPSVAGLSFKEGNPNTAYQALQDGNGIIINGIFAANNQIHIGDTLTLKTLHGEQTYRVSGIGTDFLNFKMETAYISQADMERDFQQTSDLLFLVDQAPGANSAQVAASLEAAAQDYPAFSFYNSTEYREETKTSFAAKTNMLYVLLIFLIAPSLIALINTLAINVIERTREIGMLRAVGATQNQVKRIITAESLLLAAMGTGFGILAGMWLGYVLVGGMNLGGFSYPFYFPASNILVTLAIGLLFGVVGALIPARQAARLDIVKALQYE